MKEDRQREKESGKIDKQREREREGGEGKRGERKINDVISNPYF